MSQNVTVPNNLVLAIISAFPCCLPVGIFAIIQATKVNGFVAQGNIAAAQEASAKAKKFAMIGIILGLIWYLIWGIVCIALFVIPQMM